MNVQAHMSGQTSGHVRNQIPQQNVNSMQPQLQNFGSAGSSHWGGAFLMDPDLRKAREFIIRKICSLLLARHQQGVSDVQKVKIINIARRLEDGLFKSALSKEHYLNVDTLEQRLQELIRRSSSNRNQPIHQHVNSSSSISTMMPTPGIPARGASNPMVMSSADTSVVSSSNGMATSNVNTGSFLPTGYPSNGFQQSPATFSMGPGGNHMSSLGGQRMTSQMIPTPRLNSNSIQSYASTDSGNGHGLTTVDSTTVSQQQQQKLHVGGQNSNVMHNLSNHMGSGIRSGLPQQSCGSSNRDLGSGLGMINVQLVQGSKNSEGNLTAASHGGSANQLQNYFDQHQQLMHGDGYGVNGAELSVSGTKAALINNQPNFHDQQQDVHVNSQSVNHSDKMIFQSSLTSTENCLRHRPQEQVQQHHHQFQQRQVHQLKPKSQQEQLVPNKVSFAPNQLNSGSQAKHEPGMENHVVISHQQPTEHSQLPELQTQFISGEECSRDVQMLSAPPTQHDMSSNLIQDSQNVHAQVVSESQGDYSRSPHSAKPAFTMQNESHPQRTNELSDSMLHGESVQEEFHQRKSGQDAAQPDKLSSERSAMNWTVVSKSSEGHLKLGTSAGRSGSSKQEEQFKNQQRWLLFVYHARRCPAPEGKCPESYCINVQNLWKHMKGCTSLQCLYPRCQATKVLIHHNKHCRDSGCPVCVPVREYFVKHHMKRNLNTGEAPTRSVLKAAAESKEDFQPPPKRIKAEHHPSRQREDKSEETAAISESCLSMDIQQQDYLNSEVSMPTKSEVSEVKREVAVTSSQGSVSVSEVKEDNTSDLRTQMPDGESNKSNVIAGVSNKESVNQENMTQTIDNATGAKSGKPKVKGVSLTELFTPELVREHIRGLRKWIGQSKAKAEKNQARENLMSEGSCQLCAVEKLTFEPPPIYCSGCGCRIKRNAMYYTGGGGETRHFFCIPCYNESRGDTISVDGISISKARLEKKKNDEETEESWVQCDKCEAWQHQICALFNVRRNDGGEAEYTCPNCYIEEVERGDRKPLPQSAVLGAKDLPTTDLSDHIEKRLFRKLKQERQERARMQGKSFDEVAGAEALVVRVVSSVDKKLEVKQRFLEIFQEQNYPTEFPYKSKVVLLFQKIEGVEVCLFGMYVQEFGSECAFPNQRRVYLSYLDSVKYFRPEIKAFTGEALRTFVYHEILIGYLEYCKWRGFTSCYIWACPPLKGEDYILYCHPEIQKTPKSDKLREWYLSMLRKAGKENIVVDLTNLFDHFFTQKGECKAKVTAARLPYFDGDYWPGAAEDLIHQMQQEEDGRKNQKKGSIKKTITKRALKASALSGLSGNASKDLLLMNKLGETISPMKEDFIMVHLQHCCNHCCTLMVSGIRWSCQQCKNFQLCDNCYEVERSREVRERHPYNQKEKHLFNPIEITHVPADTKDTDDILESEFFDTRQAFLSLCQGNHYQYDTLRRAKHSSMMLLYHLHNPTAPAFVTTCNVCSLDIDAGQGWRCEVCPEYDVCNTCYQKGGGINHPHKLTNHPSVADRDAQSQEARQLRVQQLRKMLDLLVHASKCNSIQCQYPNCRKLRGLFRHGMQCRIRASGGCMLCKKMWGLLQLHARACKESECNVPRCRDLKEHVRRLQQQSDSRRRAAVNEMMRQRAAEVAGGR